MKLKIFFTSMFAVICFMASAQNPIEKIFKVEYRTVEGKDSTIEVATVGTNTFTFIGNKGNVEFFNENTGEWETQEEGNKDLYLNIRDVDGFSAKISIGVSDAMSRINVETFGCCISKEPTPVVTDKFLFGSGNNPSFDLSEFFSNYGEGCYTMSINRSDIAKIDINLQGLDYITTYYIRPYVKLANGFIMYGGEKSFKSLKTKVAALANEDGIERYILLGDSIVFTDEALTQLIGNEFSYDMLYGTKQDLDYYLKNISVKTKDILVEKANKTIECEDGNLYLIKDISDEILLQLKDFFNGGIEFSPMEMLNLDASYTTAISTIDTVYCEESQGVPYNCYVTFNPRITTSNPYIGINIPKYMHNKEYSIYAVFVHPNVVNDPRPYKFNTCIYERDESTDSGIGTYTNMKYLNPDGNNSRYDYITDITNMLDTVLLGNYIFQGTPETIIQLRNNVKSRELNSYNKAMSIAKIYIVPVKEDE